jgi:hypothetical protein
VFECRQTAGSSSSAGAAFWRSFAGVTPARHDDAGAAPAPAATNMANATLLTPSVEDSGDDDALAAAAAAAAAAPGSQQPIGRSSSGSLAMTAGARAYPVEGGAKLVSLSTRAQSYIDTINFVQRVNYIRAAYFNLLEGLPVLESDFGRGVSFCDEFGLDIDLTELFEDLGSEDGDDAAAGNDPNASGSHGARSNNDTDSDEEEEDVHTAPEHRAPRGNDHDAKFRRILFDNFDLVPGTPYYYLRGPVSASKQRAEGFEYCFEAFADSSDSEDEAAAAVGGAAAGNNQASAGKDPYWAGPDKSKRAKWPDPLLLRFEIVQIPIEGAGAQQQQPASQQQQQQQQQQQAAEPEVTDFTPGYYIYICFFVFCVCFCFVFFFK